ncbi:MAG: DNA methyltransferase [Thermodesulfobacteriota bacterium]
MRVNFSDVQRNISEIANREKYTIDVLYELMAAYGRSAASITKLRKGSINLAKDKDTTVLQRGVVYFKLVADFKSLPSEVEKLEQDPLTQRYNPRFLITTDLERLAAKDTKKGNTLEIAWADIDRNVDFFYGWTGDEVTDEKTEAAADRRAADKMKELYQEVEKVNSDKFKGSKNKFRHDLNVFFSRLLFCFFAEDTGVFTKEDKNIFTNSVKDFTQTDGSDLDEFLGTLFESLDEEDKGKYTSPFSRFPYVNGKLFDKSFGIRIPKFNAQARKLILDCGALNWSEINPDIFGSMFQSIVDEEHRSTHGMHYTSVPNIMKTIEPLFLDELREEFDKHYDNPKKLAKLYERIAKIKIFDPACGSGNFLIIAYKELRKLEHAIIERLFEDEYIANQLKNKLMSRIDLNNFYGIEIDDFACEVAVLSLYLAKHQMNIEFEKQFGKEIKLIPLKDTANIVHGNAARLDWQKVCPNQPIEKEVNLERQGQLIEVDIEKQHSLKEEEWEEIYLIGNPPYQGRGRQTKNQKEDIKYAISHLGLYKGLDYISIWFEKGSDYIAETNAQLAFVSTNSITQGEQVAMLWPSILNKGLEIKFAHTSFKWKNMAKSNAGVTVIVVGLCNKGDAKNKYIYSGRQKISASNINAYLVDADDIFLAKKQESISGLPHMSYGNMPLDGGNLLLDDIEKNELVSNFPQSEKYIKRIYGAREYLNDVKRWCIWIKPSEYNEAINITPLAEKIKRVEQFRLDSKDGGTKKHAARSFQFRDTNVIKKTALIFPQTTSENRDYVPIGLLRDSAIISNAARVVYEAELWLLSLLSSKMHNLWLRAVSGRLKTDMQYSNTLSYNTFPVREITDLERRDLDVLAKKILFARENHTEKTLAEMYDPDKMPNDLREAHRKNDLLVDRLYRQKPYSNDEERLADLFKLYEEMVDKEEK